MLVFWIGWFWIMMSLGLSTGLARLMVHLFSGGF